MHTKLPCGCSHSDIHWLDRCALHASEDLITSARWANDRANPPKVTVHRINGVVQQSAFVEWAVEIGRDADAQIAQQQETLTCPEPTPLPTNGSDATTKTPTVTPIDYSALLSQF